MFGVIKRDYLLDKIIDKYEKLNGRVLYLDLGENKNIFSKSYVENSDIDYELYVNSMKIGLIKKMILVILLTFFTVTMLMSKYDSLIINITVGLIVFLTILSILYCIIKTFSYFSLTNKYKKQRKKALREVASNMVTKRYEQRKREAKFYEKFDNRAIYSLEEYQNKFINKKSKLATKSHFIYHTNLVNKFKKINALVFTININEIVPLDKTQIMFHINWLDRYMFEFEDVTVNDLVVLDNYLTQLEVKTDIIENITKTIDTVTDVKAKKEIKKVITDYIEKLDSDIENKFRGKRKGNIKENNKIKDSVVLELAELYKKL